ncbi:helix-turn-helix transcriptional regulator [Novosphingobium sp. PASSN1]|uniref:helix-turn-helix transcriptional regulator n=1 Tax=Novosphingobium sp. PASSN1 TaxID=2015561 RepID=UPI000BD57702|nr:helix-turn-helix transcriptional regulator [Novosphingobium sp. PASSN1]OYU35230.1 MAG: transcriptional regulator [Novosphingobium sp. PASSN1]
MGEMITIPLEDYERLCAASSELSDLHAYDRAMAALDSGEDERVPADFAKRLIAGESPLCVWRELRGLAQAELARISGVGRVQIVNMEKGVRGGSVATMKKLAEALGVTIDDLV